MRINASTGMRSMKTRAGPRQQVKEPLTNLHAAVCGH